MIEDEKMQVAVFRFGVISDFVTGAQMSRGEKRRLMRDKCARKWQIPFSHKSSLSIGTINRWCRLYRNSNGDLKSLQPKDRCDQGKSRAMDEDTCLSLIELKIRDTGTDRAPTDRTDEPAKPGEPGNRTEQLHGLSFFASTKSGGFAAKKACGSAQV